jgi:lambda family phage tail tape measure protein
MAKTIDELVVKITAEGTAQVTEATKAIDGLDTATKKTNESLKGTPGNVRNVAFQVQDMAVQIAGGTSAFVALGQQLPQLLGGFGVLGAVIGAVAAVGIPLFRIGLQAAGIDMRDLKERISDLNTANKDFQEAQRANLSSLKGLGNEFGSLTIEAKKFFEIRSQLTAQRAEVELGAALKELNSDYSTFTKQAREAALNQMVFSNGSMRMVPVLHDLITAFKAWRLDLTVEQAQAVADKLKGIENAKPEEAAKTLREVLEYLKGAGVESGKFLNFFEKTVKPIIDLNAQILENRRNLTAAAEAARDFNISLMDVQRASMPGIGDARRNFDTIKAFRLEGEQKIKEFAMQKAQETAKDQVDRSREVAAFRLKTEADVAEKSKDFAKGQSEAYRSAVLTNEAKGRQLDLESSIIGLKDKGLFAAEYNLKYDEEILRTSKEYNDTLASIGEQRRKNLITSQAAVGLEAEAANIRDRSNANAAQSRDAAVRATVIKTDMENMKKSVEDQINSYGKLSDQIRSINDQKVDLKFQTGEIGKSVLTQQLDKIKEDARKAGLAAGRAFAESFGQDEITPERARELADGLALIKKGYDDIAAAQIANLEQSRTWSAGWTEAYNKYYDDAFNSATAASTIFNTATKGMEDALVNFAMTGKLSFSDMANSIIADIVRILARKAILSAMGLGGDMFGGFFKAGGGTVTAGTPYVVGDAGPEMFVPTSAGTIIPNNKLSGGGGDTMVTYNINAVDASSFRSMVARDPQFIYNITEVGRRSTPSRRTA